MNNTGLTITPINYLIFFFYRVAFLECKLEAMLCLVRPEKSGSEPQMCGRNFEKCIGDALGKKWNSMIHLLLWLFCSNTQKKIYF